MVKFKKTFPKICAATNKLPLQESYFIQNLDTISKLRYIRNDLAHPKSLKHLYKATIEDGKELKQTFENYKAFISELMKNFFLKYKAKNRQEYEEFMQKYGGVHNAGSSLFSDIL